VTGTSLALVQWCSQCPRVLVSQGPRVLVSQCPRVPMWYWCCLVSTPLDPCQSNDVLRMWRSLFLIYIYISMQMLKIWRQHHMLAGNEVLYRHEQIFTENTSTWQCTLIIWSYYFDLVFWDETYQHYLCMPMPHCFHRKVKQVFNLQSRVAI